MARYLLIDPPLASVPPIRSIESKNRSTSMIRFTGVIVSSFTKT